MGMLGMKYILGAGISEVDLTRAISWDLASIGNFVRGKHVEC